MIAAKIDALRTARINKGWSCARLAREAGVTGPTITRLESGKSASPETAKRLSDALGKSIVELFDINPGGGVDHGQTNALPR